MTSKEGIFPRRTVYGFESWALKKCDEKLVTAFEMWVWHQMLRISWTEWKTSKCIWVKIGIPVEKGILEEIKHRKLSKYCCWKRRSDSMVLEWLQLRVKYKENVFLGEEEQHG